MTRACSWMRASACVRCFSRCRNSASSLQDLSAIFITHEHSDHTKGLNSLLKKTQAPVYATTGTLTALSPGFMRRQKAFPINGTLVDVGPFTVRALHVSHDAAEPAAYQIHCGHEVLTVATDLGEVSPDLHDAFAESTIAVIESNHDEELLRTGPYPELLKQRIALPHGPSLKSPDRRRAPLVQEAQAHGARASVRREQSSRSARASARTALDNPEIAVHLTAQKTLGPILTL
ncbi:MAG: MBL fold metallo-hydrolase [bacterium]|nr:MBL fold metallo-hydrolase [bacterium]